MISDLLPLLAQGGVEDPTPEELADVLWLAQRVLPPGWAPGRVAEPWRRRFPGAASADETAEAAEEPRSRQEGEEPAPEEETLGLHLPGGDPRDGDNPSGTPVRVPAAASLPHALSLARALKPLTRKVPSRTAVELDEEATVTRLVDEDILIPVLRPEPARWLGLALVVDRSPSMSLWQDEITEIQHEVARLGAFRDIRRWNLSAGADGTTVELRPHPAVNRPARHPREVVDPAGDQLIVVLTDTVGAMWRTGAAHRLLLDWARSSQVALAHLLPAALWNRVGIAPVPTLMHIPQPGLPNSRWHTLATEPHRARRGAAALPVPVVELEPRPLRAWAEMTAGSGRWTTSAALLLPTRPPSATTTGPARRSSSAAATVAPQEAIRRFRASSSPQAWRLAGLLSALSELTIPVARLVQRALLPESSRSDLAEVFLGGLLRRTTGPDGLPLPGEPRFEFAPRVRDALRGAQYREEADKVRELDRAQVAGYLRPRYGSPRGIKGALTGTSRQTVTVAAGPEAFARPSWADVAGMGASPAAAPEEPAQTPAGTEPERVFISYAPEDRAWAEWVAWHLSDAGHRVELDVWSWDTGDDFVERMNTALEQATVIVALLSPAYLEPGRWTEDEWLAGLGRNGRNGRFVPLVVEPVEADDLPAVLAPLLRKELHGLDETEALTALLEAVEGPKRPAGRPQFPGGAGQETPDTAPRPGVSNLPRRNPDFAGRENLLVHLRTVLLDSKRAAIQARHGMGGVGTTETALEYAHRCADQYDVIWWTDAEDSADLVDQLAELAVRLGVADPQGDAGMSAAAVKEHLRFTDRWLVVLDNADDPRVLDALPEGAGHVLITSRNPDWHAAVRVIRLDVFSRGDALLYLHERLPGLTAEQADTLALHLGDLPLALAQAAGVLGEGMSVERYLRLLTERTAALLNEGAVTAYPASLAATVQIAMDRLTAAHPGAASLLRLGSFFGPEPIPVRWLQHARHRLSAVPVDTDDLSWPYDSLRLITRYGLGGVDHEKFHVHRLTQAILRERTSADEAAALRSDVTVVLAAADPGDPALRSTWPEWAVLTAHLTGRAGATDHAELSYMLLRSIHYLLRSGRPDDALRLSTQLHRQWAATLGEDHSTTLSYAACLAEATSAVGDHAEARRLFEDVLTRRRRLIGDDHPDTLESAHQLAVMLGSVDDHAQARRLHEDVLARRRRVLGDDHPDTLESAHQLAVTLTACGRYAEAEAAFRDTLSRTRRVLGEEHPRTVDVVHALAGVLRALGKWSEAQKVLTDRQSGGPGRRRR
ncbi:FxSxx-COOH system tetratricopeptide repeat protein [Streptomyces sp. A012304]|uniref:FxSxx-COOH system tetratricopeptide repeat protein n=1 Tax=Streptomyces sp. A012304 TaxID=375446 RepID=UPI0022315AA2|nr:FxSxx-COOH system tetratricopeptide repeat protein [Streptomyces sp. A012304]GKQ39680.1 hypothetical protein ALMP_62070 [Streptomyces sp. A012304]